MQDQEKAHLEVFNDLVSTRRVRPTLFLPLWDAAGFMLGICTYTWNMNFALKNKQSSTLYKLTNIHSGAGSAILGKEAAMACTVAVEEAVVDHYNRLDRRVFT